MDVVYIKEKNHLASDESLKYSIRSLEKYMVDLGAIYVVGEKPKNAPLAKFIPVEDKYKKDWQNRFHKVFEACKDEQLSSDFLLIEDTTIMLKTFTGSEYPFFRAKNKDGGPNGMHCFQLKCPIKLNKEWYMRMPIQPDTKGEYAPRSFYCNFYRAPSVPGEDINVRVGKSLPPAAKQLQGKPWCSVSSQNIADPDFNVHLKNTFPDMSSVE